MNALWLEVAEIRLGSGVTVRSRLHRSQMRGTSRIEGELTTRNASAAWCENFCRTQNMLPEEESLFDQRVQGYIDNGVYDGLSPEQIAVLVRNRLLPVGLSDVQGRREDAVPDVKRTHEQKLACVRAVLEVQQAIGAEVTLSSTKTRRTNRSNDVTRHYAPVQLAKPAGSGDFDAALDNTLSDSDSDELRQLSRSVEVTKLPRHTSEDSEEKVLARNSNAVPSVLYPEQRWLGAVLATAGGSSAFCGVAWVVSMGTSVFTAISFPKVFADMAGLPDVNMLLRLGSVELALAFAGCTLVVVSAHNALRPGGALEQLKVGEVMISAEAGMHLSNWRVGLGALSVCWVLFGLTWVMAVFSLPPWGYPNMCLEAHILFSNGGLIFCTVFPLAFSGWLHSMRTASCLCRDEIIEVIHAVRTFGPRSVEWDEAVVYRALGLIDKMKLLSDGWANGLAGFSAMFWGLSLAFITGVVLNTPWNEGVDAKEGWAPGTCRAMFLAGASICAMLPFLLGLDIVATSTWCDTLMNELNDARANHGSESHLKIQWLETVLRQLVRLASFRVHCDTVSHFLRFMPSEQRRGPRLQGSSSWSCRQKVHGGLRSQALHCLDTHRARDFLRG